MRKVFALFIATILMFSLAACSDANNNETRTTEGSNNTEDQSGDNTEKVDSSDMADSGNSLIVYFTAAENSEVDAISSATW